MISTHHGSPGGGGGFWGWAARFLASWDGRRGELRLRLTLRLLHLGLGLGQVGKFAVISTHHGSPGGGGGFWGWAARFLASRDGGMGA